MRSESHGAVRQRGAQDHGSNMGGGRAAAPQVGGDYWSGLWVVVTQYYECRPNTVPTEESIKHLGEGLAALHKREIVHDDVQGDQHPCGRRRACTVNRF